MPSILTRACYSLPLLSCKNDEFLNRRLCDADFYNSMKYYAVYYLLATGDAVIHCIRAPIPFPLILRTTALTDHPVLCMPNISTLKIFKTCNTYDNLSSMR
jgi:hypothetical protein